MWIYKRFSRLSSFIACFALLIILLQAGSSKSFAQQNEVKPLPSLRTFPPQNTLSLSYAAYGKAIGGSFAELYNAAINDGNVRVIVTLRAVLPPAGNLSAMADQKREQSVDISQQNLLNSMASEGLADNFTLITSFTYIPQMVMEVDSAALLDLVNSPYVVSVQEDTLDSVSLDVSIPQIGADIAWSEGYTGTGQVVAILDTGVDKNHSFLTGKVVSEACYSTNYNYPAQYTASSICPGGVIASTASDSALPYLSGLCPTGKCDHGTHVAGIAAGNGLGAGVSFSGVAKNSSIIAIQIFSRVDDLTSAKTYCGTGNASCALTFVSDQIKGLQRVYELRNTYNIAAINMSLGGGTYTSNCDADSRKATIDLLRSAGIATVISSGNNGYTNSMSAPACISSAISVGSVDSNNLVAGYSNSATFLNLLSPGSDIYSSIPGNSWASMSGTSMAAPHVTGAFAIIRSKAPNIPVDQALLLLRTWGLPVTDTRNNIITPRITVDNALQHLNAPTDIQLSVTTVNAAQTLGATISEISTQDADSGNTFTYQLVSGEGSTDNALFSVAGNELRTASLLSAVTQADLSIRIKTTDNTLFSFEKQFTIHLIHPPTDISLSYNNILDNSPLNTIVGTLTATDQDAGDHHMYSLVSGNDCNGNPCFILDIDKLRTNSLLDSDLQRVFNIHIRATDQDGLYFEKDIIINVTTDMMISSSSISENQPPETLIGAFSSTDQDITESHTYALVNGTGAEGNANFQIAGNQLETSKICDYEGQNTYSIRVRITDTSGWNFEKQFTINILDQLESFMPLLVR